MARVTVEDCVEKVDNRFELVALAAQRAKAIASGSPITISRDRDKDSVVALREIAQESVAVSTLREGLINSFQKPSSYDDDISPDEAEDGSKASAAEIAEVMRQESAALSAADAEEELEEADGISFEEDNVEVED